MTRAARFIVAGLVLASWSSAYGHGPRGRTVRAVVGATHVAPDGSLVDAGVVRIRNDKIAAVEAEEGAGGAGDVDRYPGAVIAPGLIDLRSAIGAVGYQDESADPIDAGASAASALNAGHRDFRTAVSAGVTTVMITPAPVNLVCGVAVVVKTAGGHGGALEVLRDDGPLVFSLGPSVWRSEQAPTSDTGAAQLLRATMDRAAAGDGHACLLAFANGSLDAVVYCARPMDVRTAISTLADSNRTLSVMHTGDEVGLLEGLINHNVSLVAGPMGFAESARTLRATATASSAGVRVALAGAVPWASSDSLRMTAALAVRGGMSPAAARAAMSTTPAGIAGVADRVGAIKPGLDADLVVFSGDPLRLDSRVLAVYVNGSRVYRAAE